MVWGNDFEHPIRDKLPPGFNAAMKIVRYFIDPGLDGDVYADKPYLYGPALSSFNALYVESKTKEKETSKKEVKDDDDEENSDEENDVVGSGGMGENGEGLVFDEGGEQDGLKLRRESQVPDDEKARMKFFLSADRKNEWTWEAGRGYGFDFFNNYLDFNGLCALIHSDAVVN